MKEGYIIRRAEYRDIPGMMDLLVQVDMVHHRIRPDLFNGYVQCNGSFSKRCFPLHV